MKTTRNQMDVQEHTTLEVMIRRDATPQELDDWRKERGIHHKTYGAAVRAIRQEVAAGAPPSEAAVVFAALQHRQPEGTSNADELPPTAVLAPSPAQSPARPAQIDPVIQWLTAVRAMRDELALHGVTVAGSLRIEIEL